MKRGTLRPGPGPKGFLLKRTFRPGSNYEHYSGFLVCTEPFVFSDTVVQCLAVLPHDKKVLFLILGPCVEFVIPDKSHTPGYWN